MFPVEALKGLKPVAEALQAPFWWVPEMPAKRGIQCCAFGCNKRKKKDLRSDSEGPSDEETENKRRFPRTFHSFPADLEKRHVWLQEIRRKDWAPSKHSRLCSDHFLEKDIDRTGQVVRIRNDAIPSRFKKFPRRPKKETKKRKTPIKRKIVEDVAPSSSKDICAHDHSYISKDSPTNQLIQSQKQIFKLMSRLKIVSQRCRRLDRKVTALKTVIRDLRSKELLSSWCEDVLNDCLSRA